VVVVPVFSRRGWHIHDIRCRWIQRPYDPGKQLRRTPCKDAGGTRLSRLVLAPTIERSGSHMTIGSVGGSAT
jgi:hypothetical protein